MDDELITQRACLIVGPDKCQLGRGECFQVQEYQVDFWFLGYVYAWTQKPEVYLVLYEY